MAVVSCSLPPTGARRWRTSRSSVGRSGSRLLYKRFPGRSVGDESKPESCPAPCLSHHSVRGCSQGVNDLPCEHSLPRVLSSPTRDQLSDRRLSPLWMKRLWSFRAKDL